MADEYKQRFQAKPVEVDEPLVAKLDNLFSEEDNSRLSEMPKEQKIEDVVFMMKPGSSPGPDGFSGVFYQNCWAIVKADVVERVQSFSEITTFRMDSTPTS